MAPQNNANKKAAAAKSEAQTQEYQDDVRKVVLAFKASCEAVQKKHNKKKGSVERDARVGNGILASQRKMDQWRWYRIKLAEKLRAKSKKGKAPVLAAFTAAASEDYDQEKAAQVLAAAVKAGEVEQHMKSFYVGKKAIVKEVDGVWSEMSEAIS